MNPNPAALKARIRTLTPVTATAIVVLIGVVITLGVMPWRNELPFVVVPPASVVNRTPAEELQMDAARARERMACADCGYVENIEQLAAADGVPASYRFSVRMGDGSLRQSTGAEAAGWRIGDRIMLLGGVPQAAAAPSAPVAQ